MQLRHPILTVIFAFFVYFLYIVIIFTLARLPLSGDEPNLLLDLLPVVIGVFVPAILSLQFLRKTQVPPGEFWFASTITVVLASIVTYAILTRNCTPTTCDDDVVWFFLTALVVLGFSVGILLHKLTEKLDSRSSPPT